MEQKEYLKDSVSKVIGVIGGVSWASSDTYYRRMNEIMRDRFGSLYSANFLMYSIPFHSFAEQERQAAKGDWTMMTAMMVDAAERLKAGGADFIVIASNTLNSLAGVIEEQVGIHVLNIIDAVGSEIYTDSSSTADRASLSLRFSRFAMPDAIPPLRPFSAAACLSWALVNWYCSMLLALPIAIRHCQPCRVVPLSRAPVATERSELLPPVLLPPVLIPGIPCRIWRAPAPSERRGRQCLRIPHG